MEITIYNKIYEVDTQDGFIIALKVGPLEGRFERGKFRIENEQLVVHEIEARTKSGEEVPDEEAFIIKHFLINAAGEFHQKASPDLLAEVSIIYQDATDAA